MVESKKNKNNVVVQKQEPPQVQPQREVVESTQYKKDIKKVQKYPIFKMDFYMSILEKIIKNEPLPDKCKTHQMTASGVKYQGKWNTHIYPNIVLIYDVKPDRITLERIGSHNDTGLTSGLEDGSGLKLKLIESKQDISSFIDKFGEERYETLQKCKSKIDDPKHKDITWLVAHCTVGALDELLDKHYTRQQRIEDDIKRVSALPAADDVEKFEDNGITFYKINTPEASVKYGLGTKPRAKWCVSGGYYDGNSEDDDTFAGLLPEADYYFNDYKLRYSAYYIAFCPDGMKYMICKLKKRFNDCEIWEAKSDKNIGHDIIDTRTGEVIFGPYDYQYDCGWNDNPIWTDKDKDKKLQNSTLAILERVKPILFGNPRDIEMHQVPNTPGCYTAGYKYVIEIKTDTNMHAKCLDLLRKGFDYIIPYYTEAIEVGDIKEDIWKEWFDKEIQGTQIEKDILAYNKDGLKQHKWAYRIASDWITDEKYGVDFITFISHKIAAKDPNFKPSDWLEKERIIGYIFSVYKYHYDRIIQHLPESSDYGFLREYVDDKKYWILKYPRENELRFGLQYENQAN